MVNYTGLALRAATPAAGVALVNGTPAILSWTTPNDGNLHRFQVFLSMDVISTYTGGQIVVTFTSPGGNSVAWGVYAAGAATGAGWNYGEIFLAPTFVKAGTTVTISQGTALTAGAATLQAEIWGS
jgi:hypothetical protein